MQHGPVSSIMIKKKTTMERHTKRSLGERDGTCLTTNAPGADELLSELGLKGKLAILVADWYPPRLVLASHVGLADDEIFDLRQLTVDAEQILSCTLNGRAHISGQPWELISCNTDVSARLGSVPELVLALPAPSHPRRAPVFDMKQNDALAQRFARTSCLTEEVIEGARAQIGFISGDAQRDRMGELLAKRVELASAPLQAAEQLVRIPQRRIGGRKNQGVRIELATLAIGAGGGWDSTWESFDECALVDRACWYLAYPDTEDSWWYEVLEVFLSSAVEQRINCLVLREVDSEYSTEAVPFSELQDELRRSSLLLRSWGSLFEEPILEYISDIDDVGIVAVYCNRKAEELQVHFFPIRSGHSLDAAQAAQMLREGLRFNGDEGASRCTENLSRG